ncbi:non-hydrolyzing UDP-N-acetylglucosamine 2-epimerase [Lacticaseibacillus paracasei]|uniref:non-hydrolyzing UDP-N-acetylglucosamine 2-epimerase n=1 Tax=Lacticaseibacillus paracasei TaxID=1597 RepID=UPI0025A2794E|nr:UDP-N-acetylglucosamine 2-epimerase (non-hydrolyzing) [Lacticaseibacillus paracasei]MDM7527917.1 UDP-N-acetylglucosamine 2-epimerase (non-hydrolyzing) [Lacticaseibacillus paracasei]
MKKKIKVMSVFGTRPEAIKMAPIILGLQSDHHNFTSVTVVTAQHREMLDQVLNIFNIRPDYDLNIMHKQQSLEDITSRVITILGPILEKEHPDIVLVHGDTTTTFSAAMTAFYHSIAIGHVEAGLRTWNKESPFPEEMNRQLTDTLSDLYFAPTSQSKANLLKENHSAENIFITGNTAIDALNQTISHNFHHQVLDVIDPTKKMVLVTMHRRENLGMPMRQVFYAIRRVVRDNPEVEVVYPVHPNPKVRMVAKDVLGDQPRIHLIDPLDVIDFHNIAARSYFIMTDSGGIQEEAPSLGKPVLVLRDNTERPEGVAAGTLKLVGTNSNKVEIAMQELLEDKSKYDRIANSVNPYGDGKATQRILQAIAYYFHLVGNAPMAFQPNP